MRKLFSHTIANPALETQPLDAGDLALLCKGQAPFPERLAEFAGRVGTPLAGSESCAEHVHISCVTGRDTDLAAWRATHCWLKATTYAGGSHIVTASASVWRYLVSEGHARDLLPLLHRVGPNLFADLPASAAPASAEDPVVTFTPAEMAGWRALLTPRYAGQARVTLLAFNYAAGAPTYHSSATFLLEGVSLACTRQLRRQRAGLSLETRYIEPTRDSWQPVVPPAVAAVPDAQRLMLDAWSGLEQAYRRLRADYGISEEDARTLVPDAAQTRVVMTMSWPDWLRFARLYNSPFAQWEMRGVAVAVHDLLQALDPLTFAAPAIRRNGG